MTINLPFSKLGIVMGDAIEVPREAGARELEVYRQRVVERDQRPRHTTWRALT